MKSLSLNLCFLSISVALSLAFASGQAVTEEWLKSEYTLLLAGYISWPDEAEIDTFQIGVLASQPIYVQMSLKSGLDSLKNKPFHVSYYKSLKDIQSVDILYVDERKNNSLKKIFNKIEGQKVLVVTDSAKTLDFTMINILGMNLAGSKPFQLNKLNIDNAGLKVDPKILFVGGSEDDLRDIYRELKVEEDAMRAELDSLNQEMVQKKKELAESEQKLEQRSIEVEMLVNEIDLQTEQLTTLSDSVNLKQMDLIDKIRLLADQEKRVKQREAEINTLNLDIREKEADIADRSKLIDKQLENIGLQKAMMNDQQKILDSQKIKIERQKMVLIFFLILSVLILGLGFVSYRAYQIKKRANRILHDKNKLIGEQKSNIINQKEEIQTQRDELQEVNKKIEKQNLNITDSIYYALTIQQAMLPDVDEMKKLFDGFIVYLPKDIVSGDFYWFTHQRKKKTRERSYYLAAVDCTGHGVPGGFLSMIGARALEAIVNEYRIDKTDEILEFMDKRIRSALNQHKTSNDDGMDVCLCKITPASEDPDEKEVYLSFSGARRPLFLVRSGNEVEVIRGDRRTIGGKHFNPNPFSKNELALKKGDRIYLTSDGLMDQHSKTREKYGTRRFIEFLNKTKNIGMNEQQTKLEEEIMEFMKLEKQRDDITIMGIKL